MNPVLACSFGWRYLLILLLAIIFDSTSARSVCDRSTLGGPHLRDCLNLYDKLPYAMDEPQGDLTASRWFIEPQYLSKPFSPMRNPGTVANMVQLPKIWQLSTYNIYAGKMIFTIPQPYTCEADDVPVSDLQEPVVLQ
ncbi:MAG: hypothetical protein LQ352_006534 [Teloschistes flavicans]|nr:MAG: hypothetical protein LQ352_006534 [Teloschistes flavicans]